MASSVGLAKARISTWAAAHVVTGQGSSRRVGLLHDGVTRSALTAAPSTPALGAVAGIDHTAGQHRSAGLESLAGHLQTELIKTGEGRQVRVVKVASGTSRSSRWRASELPSSGDLDAYPRPTRRHQLHLNCEEPR